MKKIVVLACVLVLAAGCLISEKTHTLYLETDGTVTWTTLETDVRSSEDTRAKRREEEADFRDRVRRGEYAPVVFLDSLGAWDVDRRFLRERRPYSLMTVGRFDSIETLLRAAFQEVGLPARVGFETGRDWSRLTLTLDLWALEEMEIEETTFTDALWDMDLENLQLLLGEGHFVDALNFSLLDEGTRAVPVWEPDEDEVEAADGFLSYCLVWAVDPEAEVARGDLPTCAL